MRIIWGPLIGVVSGLEIDTSLIHLSAAIREHKFHAVGGKKTQAMPSKSPQYTEDIKSIVQRGT